MKRLYHASAASSTPLRLYPGTPHPRCYPGVMGTSGTEKMKNPMLSREAPSRWRCRLRAPEVGRHRRCSIAIAWSRISSQVMAHPPEAVQGAEDGVGIGKATRVQLYPREVTKESPKS